MDNIFLVKPLIEHIRGYEEMVMEYEKAGERVHPGTLRLRGLNYEGLLKQLQEYSIPEKCPSYLVPSDTFFLVDDSDRIIGAITIRHYLNEQLFKFDGNIGYGIRPSERRKGYANAMLRMALERCKDMGMEKVLITCNKGNISSAKTIMANGGIFENEIPEENGNIVERYWINL